VYDIITGILSEGRTSRLYKSLVEQKQVALNAVGFSGFPGDKYPNLVIFYGLTAPGHSLEEVANGLEEEITKLKTEPVLESEIDRVKTIAKANMLRTLDSNSGMARLLAEYQGKTGDWRNLFEQLEAIEKVTAADVQRVAQSTFTAENKTIGKILPVTQ
jgi:predicted Zn-dependent peptidase